MITIPVSDTVQVCVVDKNSGTPFLSVLEIRLLLNTTYETSSDALMLVRRSDFGGNGNLSFRYKDDIYDRIWTPRTLADTNKLNTSLTIDQGFHNGYQPPSTVMSTAETPQNESHYMTLIFRPVDPNAKFYVYLHFAEVEELKTNLTREFHIWLDESLLVRSFKPRYLFTDTVSTPNPVGGIMVNFSLQQPGKTGDSVLPPIINALEIYQVNEFLQIPTDSQDVDAMMKIKAKYRVKKNWQGDPCVPVGYSWEGLDCIQTDNTTNSRIVSLNISFSELRGEIDPAFSNLTSIEKLDLSGNDLTGEIPDFLGNLPNLTELNVEGNKLTGIIPAKLLERSNNGSLSLRFGRNPDLCLSASCQNTKKKKKKKNGYIIPLVSLIVGIIIALFTVLALFRHFKKKQQRGGLGGRNGPLEIAKRYFKYSEVVNITNNFERVLGKGGFGKVYHGVINGEQVAVKVLSQESAQGYKEFRAEVDILMRVHHTNLTSLVGYCNEGNHVALIYEYMANENLGDFLAGKRSFILSWEERLKISLDAAQGLEYLHCNCKPPIVHRDVKPANILLNEKLQAKIADFGLSRSFSVEGNVQVSTVVAGTIGYLDPEYYSTRQIDEKSDVYSLGVVLLEVITGQPAIASFKKEKRHISDQVSLMLAKGDIKGIVDQRLKERYDTGSAWKMSEIALACTEPTSAQRPTMSQVVMELKQIVYGRVTNQENGNDSSILLTVDLNSEMVPQAR
ncbi:Senescence-induced receptor-like serine/threonine-protein kinase [Cardamine amara subsp. amara]|uniref:Senescence-induced receptor-like serine/threonine-protein kinase n=1 Tax=Cardamine amara subsp. amara TaxID=228776 RepID=A0ABD1BME9_CARAN